MFRGGKDFIKVNRHAERNKEEPPDSRADPIWRLEGRRCDQLRPEGCAALGQENGIFGCNSGEDGRVDCIGGEECVYVRF